jgi:hypothetical protein
MKARLTHIAVITLFALTPKRSLAVSPCDDLIAKYDDKLATERINSYLSNTIPELFEVIQNPPLFLETMQARFAKQRAIDPKNPHAFDMTEVGIPLFKSMSSKLELKIEEVTKMLEESKNGNQPELIKELLSWIPIPKNPTKVSEYEVGIQYMKDVKREIDQAIASGHTTYRQVYEVGLYYSKSIGAFDFNMLSLREKLLLPLDRYYEGFKILSNKEEYQLYKDRKFTVYFNKKSASISGFEVAAEAFETAFHNLDNLDVLVIPTGLDLGPDIFSRLVPYDIYLVGATDVPLRADGFARPSADFWLHDMRHSSVIYEKRTRYYTLNKLTPEKAARLTNKMDVWQAEIEREIQKISDPAFRAQVEFYLFNYHHDRGFPMVPSNYLNPHPDYVAYLKYIFKRLGRQDVGFTEPGFYMENAYAWIRKFFMERLPQEQEILDANS